MESKFPKESRAPMILDKKNRNSLWLEVIKTKLKQLTEYQTFIKLDSGKNIPKGYQKISYHRVFDVKYKAYSKTGCRWKLDRE